MQAAPYSGCCAISIMADFGQNYDSRGVISKEEIVKWLKGQITYEQRTGGHSILLASVIRMQVNAIAALEEVGFVKLSGYHRKGIYVNKNPEKYFRDGITSVKYSISSYEGYIKRYEKLIKDIDEGKGEFSSGHRPGFARELNSYRGTVGTLKEQLKESEENLELFLKTGKVKTSKDVLNRDCIVYGFFLSEAIEDEEEAPKPKRARKVKDDVELTVPVET